MRYVAHTPQDLLCPLCNTAHEDEMHILFHCKSLDDLRQKHIPRKYVVGPSGVTLRLLMQDENCLQDLGRFIYHSTKRRDQLKFTWQNSGRPEATKELVTCLFCLTESTSYMFVLSDCVY